MSLEPTSFLYPFIDAEERDAGALLTDLAASAREKIHGAITAAGFQFAAVDVLGIQSGAFTMSLLPVTRD